MTTKDKILQAALELFTKQGFNKTSTAQISKQVWIASGTLFVHFKTKQDLIDAVYINIKKKSARSQAINLDEKLSVEENFKKITKNIINYYLENYTEYQYVRRMNNEPEVSQEAIKEVEKEYKHFSDIFIWWKDAWYLKDIDMSLIYKVYGDITNAILTYCSENNIKKITGEMLDIIWDAIKK